MFTLRALWARIVSRKQLQAKRKLFSNTCHFHAANKKKRRFTLTSIQELHILSEIQDAEGNIVIVYTRDCETMASARMYVLYTHRAAAGAFVGVLVSMLVKLACETVDENVSCCLSSKAQICRGVC